MEPTAPSLPVVGGPPNPAARPPAPGARSTRNRLAILLVVSLVIVGGAAAFYLLFIHEIPQAVTEADRGVLVTADELVRHYDLKLKGQGTFRHVKYLLGNHELEYEYQSPDGSGEGLYVSCLVSIEQSTKDALTTYTAQRLGTSVALKLDRGAGLRLVDQDKPFKWGEESSSSVIMGKEAAGNVFTARKGQRVFHLVIAGPSLESAALGDLLSPVLARLEAYRP
jgi:hypothetical protein